MKKIKVLLFVMMFCFAIIPSVKAASYTTNVVSSFPSSEKVTLRSDGFVTSSGYTANKGSKWGIYNKHTSSNYALCTTFSKENPDASYSCSKETTGWSTNTAVSSGVAAIMLQASGGPGKSMTDKKYFIAELAVNKYLATTSYKKTSNGFTYFGSDKSSVDSQVKSLASIGTKAANAYKNFENAKNKKKMKIALSPIKCTGTTCKTTLTTSGFKESSSNYDSVSMSKIVLNINGTKRNVSPGVITFTRPTSGAVKVKVSTKVTRTYYRAQNYSCGKNQAVTPNKVVKHTHSANLSTSRTISAEDIEAAGSVTTADYSIESGCKTMFFKVNSKGEPIEGAEFDITLTTNNGTVGPQTYVFSSSDDDDVTEEEDPELVTNGYRVYNGICIATEGLTSVTYEEKNTPDGYKQATGTISGTDLEQPVINIVDVPDTHLVVYKTDGDSGEKIGGATLVLKNGDEDVQWRPTNTTDEEGNPIVEVVKEGGNTNWVTEAGKGLHFVGLEYDEEYSVVETKAPTGYIINYGVENVTLANDNSGRSKVVELRDYKSNVKVSKQDITSSKEISGAHLQIIDSAGNVFKEWISSTTPYEINDLEDGQYYLKETIAPDGYLKTESTIEFAVENGKVQKHVVMYNSPKNVNVANTLLAKRTITYIIGLMLILGGAGVLGYELKKKKKLTK